MGDTGHSKDGENGHPAMDYAEHNRTYDAFIRFSVIGVLCVVVILIAMAIGTFGHRWGLGTLFILAALGTSALGVAVKSLDWKPVGGVLGLSVLAWIATSAG
jgi:hypothetical protein